MITLRWTLNKPSCQSACADAKVSAIFLCGSFSCAISYRRLALLRKIIPDIHLWLSYIFVGLCIIYIYGYWRNVRSRGLDISLVGFFFGVFMDRDGVQVHKNDANIQPSSTEHAILLAGVANRRAGFGSSCIAGSWSQHQYKNAYSTLTRDKFTSFIRL